MENVRERIKEAMKAWQEKYGEGIISLLENLKEGLRESPQVRAITAVVVAACGLGGFFLFQGDEAEMASGANTMQPAVVVQTNTKKADRLEVAGADRAMNKTTLRNPFLPEHPTREESQQRKSGLTNNTVAGAAAKGTVGATGGAMVGQINGMPISVPVKQAVGKEQKQIYLQGIIDTEGTPGALLTLEGQTRFLLAGESWQGYVLESVSGEEAAVNGHIIHIGDTVAM